MEFGLPLSCPGCGDEDMTIIQSRVNAGTELLSVIRCGCGREWYLTAHLRELVTDDNHQAKRAREYRARKKETVT